MAKRILLADDSVTAQNMGRKILSDAGYEVVTVNNGSAALKRIAEQKPELIVLDVYMPGYSGLEVCQRLKEAPETAAIPVLLTVGKLEPFKAEEAKRVHADAHIVKPFEATELLTVLTKLEDKIAPQPVVRAAPARSQAKSTAAKTPQTAPSAKSAAPAKAAPSKPEAEVKPSKKTAVQAPAPVPSPPPPRIERPSAPEPDWMERVRAFSAAAARSPESEPVAPPATAFHDLRAPSVPEAAVQEDPSFAVNLPPDITSEELAAITEAAASLAGESEHDIAAAEIEEAEAPEPAHAPEFAGTFAALPSEPAGTEAPAEAHVEEFAAAPAAESAVEEPAVVNRLHQIAEEAVADHAPERVELTEPEKPGAEPAAEREPVRAKETHFSESEVDDVLASLGPRESVQFEGVVSAEAHAAALADHGVEVYPRGRGSLVEELYGARWVAEEVPLDASIAGLSLEEEMQRVYTEAAAARAHAEIVIVEAPVAEEPVTQADDHYVSAQAFEETPAEQEYGTTVDAVASEVVHAETVAEEAAVAIADEVPTAQAEEIAQPVSPEPSAEEHAAVEALGFVAPEAPAHAGVAAEAVAEEQPVAGHESSFADEPAHEHHASEATEATVTETAAVAHDQATHPVHDQRIETGVSEETIPAAQHEALEEHAHHRHEEKESAVVVEASHEEPVEAAVSEVQPPASDFPSSRWQEDEQPPDVAAAWARWRQIRDSLASPEFTAQLADAAAAELAAQRDAAHSGNSGSPDTSDFQIAAEHAASEFKDIRENPPAAPTAEAAPLAAAAAASSSAADSAVISNIVESVLAELKPKLVEEIARKLSKQ